ncbi:MAG: DALR domain-containing protein, partial [Bacteroidota bacterium]
QFDIHGGGMDLKFPHHECEVAQCKAGNGEDPVKYWLHTNMLTFEGARMSKSTGNSILPGELFSGNHDLLEQAYSPMTVRFFMMQAHYRNPLDFSNSALLAADKALQKLMAALESTAALPTGNESSIDVPAWKARCYEAMNDDFNTPVLIAQLFEAVKFINSVKGSKATITSEDRDQLHTALHGLVNDVLGLRAEAADGGTDESLVNGLMDTILDMRQEAKANKDWGTADKIRDALSALNIRVKDGKEGATWSVED